jgi:phospholipid-binding lipoprotein MlaA
MANLILKYNKILFFIPLFSFLVFSTSAVQSNENEINDPFEKANRAIFKLNNNLDDHFFKPVAKGWRKLPDIPRKPLSNLATTAKTPVSLANAVLQFNKTSIGNIIGRFLINMTFGLGGMFDMASTDNFGNMPEVEEDFGQTLAVWGVPDGPYVMLPIFGPSSIRDAVGLGVDTVTNPLSFAYRMNSIGMEARLSGPVVRGVTTREKYLGYLDEMKEGSLDFYATMRSLYRQKRRKDISGEMEEEKISLDLLPVDIYEDEDLKTEIKNIVAVGKSVIKTPRYYNGVLPSSNYPGFSESRVNLIE